MYVCMYVFKKYNRVVTAKAAVFSLSLSLFLSLLPSPAVKLLNNRANPASAAMLTSIPIAFIVLLLVRPFSPPAGNWAKTELLLLLLLLLLLQGTALVCEI